MMRVRRGPVIAVAAIALVALLVPLLPLADPLHMDVAHHLAPPSLPHPLGQDEYGRDVLSRLLWGARTSLVVAAASASLACLFGTALGLVGGFVRGVAELVAVRSMDIVLCFPPLLLALLIVTLLGPGAATLIPVLAVLYLPGFVRVVYAGVLSVRSQDYVEAMRALGAGPSRIMLRTILPNVAGPVLVQFSLAAASAVVLESGLSFLGLGVVPPAPSWGLMIGAARATMEQAPLLLLWPCAALSLTILAMNALCDALRDAVDPHTQPARLPAAREAAATSAASPGHRHRGARRAQPDRRDRYAARHDPAGAGRVVHRAGRRDAGDRRRKRIGQDADRPRADRAAAAGRTRQSRAAPGCRATICCAWTMRRFAACVAACCR